MTPLAKSMYKTKEERCDMRKLLVILVLGMMATPALSGDAVVGVDLVHGYVWRGITFNEGAVVQPSVDVGLPAGIALNVWGNFDIDDNKGTVAKNEFSEIDLTLSKGVTLGPVELTTSYIEYLFPHQGDTNSAVAGTREVSLSASIGIPGGISMGLTGYYDFDEVEDGYAELSVGFSTTLPSDLLLAFSGALGYAGTDMSAGTESGLHDVRLSLALSSEITDATTIKGFVSYTDGLDDDVLPEQPVDIYGGIGISTKL